MYQHSYLRLGIVDPACPIDWAHPLNVGLLAEWTVTPNSGWSRGLSFYDLARGGRNPSPGTLTNGPTWVGGNARKGGFGGIVTDGVNDYVDLGQPSKLTLTGSMTMSLWMKNPSDGFVFNKYEFSSSRGPAIITASWPFSARDVSISVTSDGSAEALRATTTGTISTTDWFHFAGVYDAVAQTLNVYVNGINANGTLTGTVPASQTTTGNAVSWKLGARSDGVTGNVSGSFDGLTIHNRALSAQEMVAWYQECSIGNPNRWKWLGRRSWFFTEASGGGALSGTSNPAFTNTATLSGAGELAGSSTPTFTDTGTLSGAGALAGSSAPTFTNSGTLAASAALAGSSSPAFVNSGTLAGAGELAGTSTLAFTSSGILTGAAALAGTSSPAFTSSGAITGDAPLAGSSSPAFTNSGVLSGAGALAGSAAPAFSAVGQLLNLGSGDLLGSSSLAFTNAGAVTGAAALAGSAAPAFSSSGTLQGAGSLAGSASLSFAALGVIIAQGASTFAPSDQVFRVEFPGLTFVVPFPGLTFVVLP